MSMRFVSWSTDMAVAVEDIMKERRMSKKIRHPIHGHFCHPTRIVDPNIRWTLRQITVEWGDSISHPFRRHNNVESDNLLVTQACIDPKPRPLSLANKHRSFLVTPVP
jgi:hypothetical protein